MVQLDDGRPGRRGADRCRASAPSSDVALRGGTAPLWTGEAHGLEVIVQAQDGSTPRDVQVQLIDPGTSPADAAPGAPKITDQAHAAMAMPGSTRGRSGVPTRAS